jgi:hypothetical protein
MQKLFLAGLPLKHFSKTFHLQKKFQIGIHSKDLHAQLKASDLTLTDFRVATGTSQQLKFLLTVL